MKQKIVGALEGFSKAMVQPLMYLSAAGILMVFGVLLTNSTFIKYLPFLAWEPIQIFGQLIYNGVMVIINNLGVIFAIGIPAAFAKSDKHRAALVGFMAYLIYLVSSNTLLNVTGQLAAMDPMLGLIGSGQASILGIQVVDMSVFGGILMGCITGYVFNRTYTKRFKGALQIYSGANFSFICIFFIAIIFAVTTNYFWPIVQSGIASLALFIKETGNFGLFLYGFLERLLIPTGLHHLVYTPFQFTDLGGVLQLGETTIAGAYGIVMTEMNLPIDRFSDSIYYMATGFTKMFGYIGIGGAFIYCAKPENKKKTRALIIPLIITACLASVTEPLDFMFVFVAPLLYVVHSAIAGIFIVLLRIFDVTAFCGGNLIASFLMNIAAGTAKTNWPVMFILGLVQIVVYFFLFTFIIKKFNLKTPGREDSKNETAENNEIATQALPELQVASIIDGLGGLDNIVSVENCITRLRVEVKNIDLINKDLINETKNSGIVLKGNNVQIIYGLQVHDVRREVDKYIADNKNIKLQEVESL